MTQRLSHRIIPQQPPLFQTPHPDCDHTGWQPDPEEPQGSGWVVPCPVCNPDGERHYDPYAADIPY